MFSFIIHDKLIAFFDVHLQLNNWVKLTSRECQCQLQLVFRLVAKRPHVCAHSLLTRREPVWEEVPGLSARCNLLCIVNSFVNLIFLETAYTSMGPRS